MAEKKVKAKENKKEAKPSKPVKTAKEAKASKPAAKKAEESKEVVVRAEYKRFKSSPQKLRLVANLIRGKDVTEAIDILMFTRKKGARLLLKLVKSAVANAENNFDLDQSSLYISMIRVDEGLKLPRYRVASRGRINKLIKRRSRALIELKVR